LLNICCAGLLFGSTTFAAPSRKELKLLFSTPDDVSDVWGKLHFGATPMQKIRSCKDPGFTPACCLPREDDSWEAYGQSYREDASGKEYEKKNTWKLVHATTRDGENFDRVATVLEGEPGCWTSHVGLAYNPDAGEFLLLKLKYDRDGFGYMAF